jgi:hypothetical protein
MVIYRGDTAQDRKSEPSEMETQTRVHQNTETHLSSYLATMDKQVQKEVTMELFIILLLAPIVLGIAAPRWGFDSRDTFNSAEWRRRNEVSYLQLTPKKSK